MRTKRKSPGVGLPGQATTNSGGRLLSTTPVYTRNAPRVKQVACLADLRRQYNQAVLAKDWAAAERLQRAYHQAERERRAELLQQAVARGRRNE